ncbi:hypothetical protein HDU91_002772 [Kappamyces sp. JEL0680]|nr:hypothetical protein HDU91_002772 [Kappamyces sp. JEL0680]
MLLNIDEIQPSLQTQRAAIVRHIQTCYSNGQRATVVVHCPALGAWTNQDMEGCLASLYNMGNEVARLVHSPLVDMDVLIDWRCLSESSVLAAGDDSQKYDNVVLGGTFDHLHAGHKILLSMAVWISRKRVVVGVSGTALAVTLDYSPERLARKKYGHQMEGLQDRLQNVSDFLTRFKHDSISVLEIVPIQDDYGPTRTDPDMDLIVGSLETSAGCEAAFSVNAKNFYKGLSDSGISDNTVVTVPFSYVASVNKDVSKAADAGSIGADSVSLTLVGTIGVGSALFWVRSSACTTSACLAKDATNKYDASKSSTAKAVTPSLRQSVTYGDGTVVRCSIGVDDITVGSKIINGQRLCIADYITTDTAQTDGLIGLSPPGYSLSNEANVFGTLLNQSSSASTDQISFWYNPSSNFGAGQAGEITFGGVDTAKFTGAFTNIPLTSNRVYWEVVLSQITSGSTKVSDTAFPIIMDTGTSLALLPESVVATLNQLMGATVNSQGFGIIDCAKGPSLPSITFSFAGAAPLTLSGKQLYIVDGSTCASIFLGTKDDVMILGATFLRNYYTVFDYSNAQVSLATPTGQTTSTNKNDSSRTQVGMVFYGILAFMIVFFNV